MFDDLDPFTASPAELIASVADLEPGPFVMSVLLMIDRTALAGEDAVAFLQVHERVTSWWASVQADALVAAASPERMVDEFLLLDPRPGYDEARTIRIEDAVREEVAAAVRWSPATAQQRIDTARLLAGPLPATRAALACGEITAGHVNTMVEAARRLPGRLGESGQDQECFARACTELERRVLPVARRATLSATRAAAHRAVLAIDAEGERRRRAAARCTRAVYVVDEIDGISTLIARMSTLDAHAVLAAVEAKAHDPELQVTPGLLVGERRALALAALVLRGDAHDVAIDAAPAVHLDVVVDLATLVGLDDAPAHLRGAGPLLVDDLRELLRDPAVSCTMRRLVSDPVTGHLLDVGRRTYDVPAGLRALVVARDGVCRFPGCRRRASRCQMDHAQAWDDGGGTDAANLGALCVRHHQLKTHAGWQITTSAGDGSCTWLSPHGRVYEHPPEPVLR